MVFHRGFRSTWMSEGRARLLLTLGLAVLPGTADAAAFQVEGIFQFGPSHFAVAFTDSVDLVLAAGASHYSLTPQAGAPALIVQGAKIQENQRTVVLATDARLPQGASYDVTITGVSSQSGVPLSPGGPSAFTSISEAVHGIDDVQANAASLMGQSVTVIGQVFIRASSAGGAPSAWIEDGTGRGINVLGSLGVPVEPAVDDLGSIAKVTGTVAQNFTTLQLTPFTATAIASAMPALAPHIVAVSQASSPQWEGTYIRTTGTLTAPPSAYGANDYRYQLADGGTAFTFRVRNSAGIDPNGFTTNDVVTGAGAGGAYPFRYQITVANAADLHRGPGSADTAPPTLFSASGIGGRDSITVVFSEAVGAGASAGSNYSVFPTANPGGTLAVSAVSAGGATAILTLAAALQGGVAYTIQVSNVQDVAGNRISANATLAFTAVVPDVAPPTLLSASGTGGRPSVAVAFSEPVFAGAAIPSNYEIFPSGAPGSPIAASAATPSGATVTLALSAPLEGGLAYVVRVNNVQDLAGNSIAANSAVSFTASIPVGFVVRGVFQFGKDYVGVGFSEPVSAGAIDPVHYVFAPALSIAAITLQANGQTVIIKTSVPLTAATSYSLTMSGITSASGAPLADGGPFTFQSASGAVTNIAEIQANVPAYKRQTVTLTGQVFIPVSSRGGTPSGYIQDGSGRGINLFGSAVAALNDLGNIVRVTGTVDTFNTTIELLNYGNNVSLLASGQPRLGPKILTVRQANSPAWEGTYIQTTATLTGPPTASGANNYSYNAAEGGAAITFRVGNALGIDPGTFASGDRVTGGGAGGAFQTTFQINVGNVFDFFKVAGGVQTNTTRLTVEAATLIKNLGRISIQIEGPSGSHSVCRIFDLQGRMVKVLFDGRLYGTETLTWDGRDDSFEYVPAGMYICHLQSADARGHVNEDRAPIVVAVRLN